MHANDIWNTKAFGSGKRLAGLKQVMATMDSKTQSIFEFTRVGYGSNRMNVMAETRQPQEAMDAI